MSIFLSLSFGYYTQLFTIACGTDFHGVGDIFETCNEDITITALPVDGSIGSIISGEISSSGSIHILPGASSVKIVAEVSDIFSKTIQSKNSNSTSIERRSLIGGNGGKTIKPTNHKTISYYIDTNENLVFQDLNSSIIFYEIYDIYSTLIMDYNAVKPIDNKIALIDLENDIYIIKIQLENGEILTKTIVKQ
ncbi:hypothetical protein GCM10022397_26210 [Flavivirga jejuensis]